MKVWARGTGQASFDLNIVDGVAEVKLGFKLGRPSEPHCHEPAPVHHHPPGEQQQHHRRRHKAAGRRERDQQRVQQHKAGIQAPASSPASAPALEVILPVTGKLLPVRKPQTPVVPNMNVSSTKAAVAAAVSSPAVSSIIPADASPQASEPQAVSIPVKSLKTSQKYKDVDNAKKNLFSLPPKHQPPRDSPALNSEKNYHKREYELWSKLFET